VRPSNPPPLPLSAFRPPRYIPTVPASGPFTLLILGFWPDAVPFDPHGADSPVLHRILGGPAAALTAVALVAGPAARAAGGAARAALAVARAWPGTRRIVLADLDLAAPSLHALLGASNDEGAVDMIDYGLSPGHVLQVVDDGRLDFLPAGAYAPDPAATLAAPGWSQVVGDVAARGATLLAYVPADAGGLDGLLRHVGAVLLLAEADEWQGVGERLSHPYAVIGVLTPAAEVETMEPEPRGDPYVGPATSSGRLTDEEFERIRLPRDAASRGSLIADLRDRQRAARMTPAPEPEPVAPPAPSSPATAAGMALPAGMGDAAVEMRLESAADDVPGDTLDPTPLVRAPVKQRSRYRHPLAWTLGVVLLAALLAGAWRYLAARLAEQELVAPPEATPAVLAPVPPQPQPLPWVVAVEAHRDLATALGRVDALAAGAAPFAFHVAPLELDGTLFYHVMAGPVSDSTGALALRDSLIARGHKTGAAPSDVRHAPLAFLIGEYSSAASAAAQLDELRRLDVPGYRVDTEAADGAPLHRIYVGGFGAAAEADVIRQLLRAAGIRDSLVTRTGSITQ